MTRRPPDWDDWRIFRETMRDASFTGAAQRLQLMQPTVGRRMDALEAALGFALFARSPRGLAPTEAAYALLPHAETMAASAAALQRSAAGVESEDVGVVRISASEMMGGEVLPAMLSKFRSAHPRVAVELSLSNRYADLSRRDADIAVRMARPSQARLRARKIGVARIGLYAHRDYLARFGAPGAWADLRDLRLIGFDADNAAFRSAGRQAQGFRREDFVFRCDSDLAQLAALRAGLGIGGALAAIADRTPELVRLFAREFSAPLEIWLVAHEDVIGVRRVRLMWDALVEGLTAFVRAPAKPPMSEGKR